MPRTLVAGVIAGTLAAALFGALALAQSPAPAILIQAPDGGTIGMASTIRCSTGTTCSVSGAVATVGVIAGGGGGVASVTAPAGGGLVVGGTSTDPTVAIDAHGCGEGWGPEFDVALGGFVCGPDGEGVTAVTATAPLASSGGATPNLSMPAATTSQAGYLSAADWTSFDGRVASVEAIATGGLMTFRTDDDVTIRVDPTGCLDGWRLEWDATAFGWVCQPDDNTTYTGVENAGTRTISYPSDPQGIGLIECADTQILRVSDSLWQCSTAPLTDTDTKPGASCAADERLTWNGSAFSCASVLSALAGISCTNGYVLKWSSSLGTWQCAQDLNTTYTAGNQLSLTGSTFAVVEGAGSGLDADLLDGQHGAYYASISYVHSRGMNLVTNGFGTMGSNYNFESTTYDATDTYAGPGSFRTASYNGGAGLSELIPVDPGKFYEFRFWGKANPYVGARHYAFASFYDADNQLIMPYHHMFQVNTHTTLAAPLRPGDTTITLASSANWNNSHTATHIRSIILWGYTNSKGYTYPPYTYSRHWVNDAYPIGGIDTGTHVVTLNVPWPATHANPDDVNGEWPIGTPLSNGSSHGYKYFTTCYNSQIPSNWTEYRGTIGEVDLSGTNYATKFPPGSTGMKLGFLVNRDTPGGAVNFSALWLSEANASQLTGYREAAIWHDANDGTGSGLDADKLDGMEASELSVLSASNAESATTASTAYDLVCGTSPCVSATEVADLPGTKITSAVAEASLAYNLQCASGCVADAEIIGVSGSKVTSMVGTAGTAQALAADPADCAAGTYATTIAADGDLTCAVVQGSQINGEVAQANYSTYALMFNHDPTDCTAGKFATAINAGGNLTCSTPPDLQGVTDIYVDPPLYTDNDPDIPTIGMTAASATQNGYLSSANWSLFNGKQDDRNFVFGLWENSTAGEVGVEPNCGLGVPCGLYAGTGYETQYIPGIKNFWQGVFVETLKSYWGLLLEAEDGDVTIKAKTDILKLVDVNRIQATDVAGNLLIDVPAAGVTTKVSIVNSGGVESTTRADLDIEKGDLLLAGVIRTEDNGPFRSSDASAGITKTIVAGTCTLVFKDGILTSATGSGCP